MINFQGKFFQNLPTILEYRLLGLVIILIKNSSREIIQMRTSKMFKN